MIRSEFLRSRVAYASRDSNENCQSSFRLDDDTILRSVCGMSRNDSSIFARFAPQGDGENAAGTGTKEARTQKKWAIASHFHHKGGSLLTCATRRSESPPTRTNLLHTAGHCNLNKKRIGPWQIDWSTGGGRGRE